MDSHLPNSTASATRPYYYSPEPKLFLQHHLDEGRVQGFLADIRDKESCHHCSSTGNRNDRLAKSDDGNRRCACTSVVSSQWSVVSGQWSVVSSQWSVVSSQWSVV